MIIHNCAGWTTSHWTLLTDLLSQNIEINNVIHNGDMVTRTIMGIAKQILEKLSESDLSLLIGLIENRTETFLNYEFIILVTSVTASLFVIGIAIKSFLFF